jgi:ribonuclease BN (tRNA processing enzyme)
MRIRVLGCSGGIGGSLRTTSLLVDEDILVDAGTGVGDLSLDRLTRIDHVFITHSHLDHIACLPFLVDTTCWLRRGPVTVYGLPETLQALRDHIFNWKIWPDFTQIPAASRPCMVYREVGVGETITLADRRITPIPANHTVPAVGYAMQGPEGALVYSGDTGVNDGLWEVVNALPRVDYLIIETAFSNKERDVASASKHLYPEQLASELAKMTASPEVYVTHLKPGEGALTMREVGEAASRWQPRMLENNQEFVV